MDPPSLARIAASLERIPAPVSTVISLFAGAALLSLSFVFLPRAGPGRALGLALRSFSAHLPAPHSMRTSDVLELRSKLSSISRGRYIAVKGPNGIGKSCVIARALERTCGVVTVEVSPNTSMDAIVRAGLEAVSGSLPPFVDPRPSALRVLWWYSLLPLPPPIVVLRMSECSAGVPFAQTAGAVRSLASCGLRVVINSSPKSLEPEALATLRQDIMHLEPMPRGMILSLPENAQLIALLRREGLEDAAWAVLGGVPALYTALHDDLVGLASGDARGTVGNVLCGQRIDLAGVASSDARFTVGNFLYDQLQHAIVRLRRFDKPEAVLRLLALFKTKDEVPAGEFEGNALPSPNNVLREARKGAVYVPADAAMGLVLRHGLKQPPTLKDLCLLCAPVQT